MYCLQSIIEQNRRAEALGIIKAGTAVGTTGFVPANERPEANPAWAVDGQPILGHRDDNGGLRGHSIGNTYPWQCAAGVDEGCTVWTVTNYLTGETGNTYRGLPESKTGCALAHRECELRAAGRAPAVPLTTTNEEY